MNLDLLEQIRARLPQFSKAQKRIAHYILEHYEKAAFMTAARIGSTIGVSESTVVRFAAEVGCDGYPQLQKALQEIIRNRLTSVQRMEITSDQIDRGNVISKVLSMDIERIKHTMEELDTQSFDLAVQKIIHARRIYIIGVRSAASLASFLQFYFNHIFDSVILINTSSTSEMFEQLFRISDQDVLISISFPRYSQRTLKAAKYAREKGADVIALTDSISSPDISVSRNSLSEGMLRSVRRVLGDRSTVLPNDRYQPLPSSCDASCSEPVKPCTMTGSGNPFSMAFRSS